MHYTLWAHKAALPLLKWMVKPSRLQGNHMCMTSQGSEGLAAHSVSCLQVVRLCIAWRWVVRAIPSTFHNPRRPCVRPGGRTFLALPHLVGETSRASGEGFVLSSNLLLLSLEVAEVSPGWSSFTGGNFVASTGGGTKSSKSTSLCLEAALSAPSQLERWNSWDSG